MKTSIFKVTVLAGMVGLASACGGDDTADLDDPGLETTDPYATDPAATTAPPAGMGADTMGMDTMGMDTMMMRDTMRP